MFTKDEGREREMHLSGEKDYNQGESHVEQAESE